MSTNAKYIVWHDNDSNEDKSIMVEYAKCDSDGNHISSTYSKRKLIANNDHKVGECALGRDKPLANGSTNYKATLQSNVVVTELRKFCNDDTYYLPIIKIISDDGTINIVCTPIISDGCIFGFKNYIDSTQVIVNTETGEIAATTDSNGENDSIILTFYFDKMEA